jgi:hypothetical protein
MKKDYVIVIEDMMLEKEFIYHKPKGQVTSWHGNRAMCDPYAHGTKVLRDHIDRIPFARPCKRCKW